MKDVLEPMLRGVRAARSAAGCSLELTIPVFHATDTYHKHRNQLDALHAAVWQELRIRTDSNAPKGIAPIASPSAYDTGASKALCRITGEPFHDIINLRRAASPHKMTIAICCSIVWTVSDGFRRLQNLRRRPLLPKGKLYSSHVLIFSSGLA